MWYTSGMNDMSKPTYLVEDNKGYKLRRNIPARLQSFAELDPSRKDLGSHKTIVERLNGMTWAEMCKAARAFGSQTDIQFDKWERQLSRLEVADRPNGDEPWFKFALSETEAEQIALAYFLEREKKFRANGYLIDRKDLAYEAFLSDAQRDLADVVRVHQGAPVQDDASPRMQTERTAAKLLLKYEYILESEIGDGKRIAIPDELRDDRVFQLLCRKIEEADIEIATRCVEALEKASPPSVHNQFFSAMVLPDANPQPYKRQNKTLSELTDAYLTAKQDEGLTKSRLDQFRIPIRFLHEEFGQSRSLLDVTLDECDELVSMLHAVPANYTKTYPGLTIREAIAAHEVKTGAKEDRRKAALDNIKRRRVTPPFLFRSRLRVAVCAIGLRRPAPSAPYRLGQCQSA